jgi:hypothetical protein
MSTCPNALCGAPDPMDADFCPACGTYLRFDELTGERQVRVAGANARRVEAPTTAPRQPPQPTTAPPQPVGVDQVKLEVRVPGAENAPGARPVVEVVAGGEAVLSADVRNQGEVTARFRVRVEGIPPEWWSVPDAPLYLNPFSSREADTGRLQVTLHPPRSSAARAGDHAIEVVVGSSAGGEARVAATLVIAPFAETVVTANPHVRSGRRRARFALTAENLGNAPAGIELHGEDREEACRIDVAPPTLPLAPGERRQARLTVRARKHRWFGRPVEHIVALEAGPVDAAPRLEPASVTFRHRAWLPWWVPPVVLVAIAVAALVPPLLPHYVRVPEVRGAAGPFEAQRRLEPAGLRVAPQPEVRQDDRFAPGTVLDQSPAPGSRARRGALVTLVVAAGNGTATVPDLKGKTLQEADAALSDEGLELGSVSPRIDPAGRIGGQVPAPGQHRSTGTPVDVTLAPPGHPAARTTPDSHVAAPPARPGRPSPTRTPAPEPRAALIYDDGRDLTFLPPGRPRPQPLTADGASTEPAVSPDGQAVAYRREVGGRGQIFLMHPMRGDAPGQPLTTGAGDYGRPAFVGTGGTVAYVRHSDYALCFTTASAGAAAQRCLTDRTWAFNRPTASPDGHAVLAIATDRADQTRTGIFEWRNDEDAVDGWTPAATGPVMEVTAPQFIAWGPDGSVAVMAGPPSQAAQLTVVPTDGDRLDPAAAERRPVFGCEVAWRADGALAVAEHACNVNVANGPIAVVDPQSARRSALGVQGGNPVWADAHGRTS